MIREDKKLVFRGGDGNVYFVHCIMKRYAIPKMDIWRWADNHWESAMLGVLPYRMFDVFTSSMAEEEQQEYHAMHAEYVSAMKKKLPVQCTPIIEGMERVS